MSLKYAHEVLAGDRCATIGEGCGECIWCAARVLAAEVARLRESERAARERADAAEALAKALRLALAPLADECLTATSMLRRAGLGGDAKSLRAAERMDGVNAELRDLLADAALSGSDAGGGK